MMKSILFAASLVAVVVATPPAPSPTPAPPAYDQSYYPDFYKGGYSSMGCGYGYKKDDKGYCGKETWVRDKISQLLLQRY
jgi:hypothetical protein